MAGSFRRHEEAAARHQKVAVTHDRAAAFWENQGDPARADLHRDGAAHEHAGAALERRWAELITSEDAGDAAAEDEQRFEAFRAKIERLERVGQSEERQQAAARREQAALDREQATSERDPNYHDPERKR